MKIRKSTEHDFPRIMEIYAFAREYMKTHGNPNQWGPTNWPPEKLIHNDIKEGNSYVCLNDSEKVIGVFYFIQGKDIEPTYINISEGAWTGSDTYGVVHRVAGDGSDFSLSMFSRMVAFSRNVRIKFSLCKKLCGIVGASCDSREFNRSNLLFLDNFPFSSFV